MIGWSGSGRFDDLERTSLRRLAPARAEAHRVGHTLVIDTTNPVAAARSLALLPGVAWIAVGFRFKGEAGYLRSLGLLGRRYLRSGASFRISAESERSGRSAGDLVLAGNSELLASIGGSRVDERRPRVRFRVSVHGEAGACGAEIHTGPGGAPTGGEWVSCLVSGGERSSSMTWMTALAGFSIRMVHAQTDEEALRHVARLYSELSFRMDPSRLELVLLEGDGPPFGRIGGWLREEGETTFSGHRLERASALPSLAGAFPNLAFPLLLLDDGTINGVYASLGLGRRRRRTGAGMSLKLLQATRPYSKTTFGRVQADSNAVVDGLKRRR